MKARILPIITWTVLQAACVNAQPVLDTAVANDTVDNTGFRTISITGSQFGVMGPVIVLYEDFDKLVGGSKGNDGDAVPFGGPLIGAWSNRGVNEAHIVKYVAEGNNRAMLARDFDFTDPATSQLQVIFGDQTDVFLSFGAKVPEGATYPGSTKVETFPPNSTWKFSWLSDTDGIRADELYDMTIPTSSGGGPDDATLHVSGNDGSIGSVQKLNEWWRWAEYNYMSFGQVAGADPDVDNGYIYYRHMSSEPVDVFERDSDNNLNFDRPVMFPAPISQKFDRLAFPGWWGNGDNTNFNAYYDNIYVAVGENAFARVEITDSKNYLASTMVIPLPITKWGDIAITARINQDFFNQKGKHFYVHIFDKENKRSAESINVTCPTCPGKADPVTGSGSR